MNSIFSRHLTASFNRSTVQAQRAYTVVVERLTEAPFVKPGKDPRKLPLRPVNMHYKLVDCSHNQKWGNLDLILTEYVEGVGRKGEIVNVPRHMAYYDLLPKRLAVYPTDEYLEMYKTERESYADKAKVSPFSFKTKEKLSEMTLEIPMNPKVAWTLTEDQIRIALRYNVLVSSSYSIFFFLDGSFILNFI